MLRWVTTSSSILWMAMTYFQFIYASEYQQESLPFQNFKIYFTPIYIPPIVDMTAGGSIVMETGLVSHNWGGGLVSSGTVYGFRADGFSPFKYPGPTIISQTGIPTEITWVNNIPAPHLLHQHIDPSLLIHKHNCYPKCGVPVVLHVHGLRGPAIYDGLPGKALDNGESSTYSYLNVQNVGNLPYHDHSPGLMRLNTYAGLIGTYLITDSTKADQNIFPRCDFVLMIQDKIVGEDGSLMYANSSCRSDQSNWIKENFGTINVVNGIAYPYLEVPQEQCRLRISNLANARHYNLNLPFYSHCQVVARGAAPVNVPQQLKVPFTIYPFVRVDMICDFSVYALGSSFNITNVDTINPQGSNNSTFHVMQIRVTQPGIHPVRPVASNLNDLIDLRTLWIKTNGLSRNMTLGSTSDSSQCPTSETMSLDGKVVSFNRRHPARCVKGTVERWFFRNPTPDIHSFHWHMAQIQCGSNEFNHDTNQLRDVFPIPSSYPVNDVVTQVCFVACTPSKYIQASTHNNTDPKDFGFSTSVPYLLYCHILEHAENDMMAIFILDEPSQLSGLVVGSTKIVDSGLEGFYAANRAASTLIMFVVVLLLILFASAECRC